MLKISRKLFLITSATLFAISMLIMTGCDSTPPLETENSKKLLSSANDALENMDYKTAADIYLNLAAQIPSPDKEDMTLKAAYTSLGTSNTEHAETILTKVTYKNLSKKQQEYYNLIKIKILFMSKKYEEALVKINSYGETFPDQFSQELLNIRSSIYENEKKYLEAASDISKTLEHISDPALKNASYNKIWLLLNKVPLNQLDALMPPAPDSFGGWLELSYFIRKESQSNSTVETIIADWKERYPNHEAIGSFTEKLIEDFKFKFKEPKQIALLLPLSGKLRGHSSAIRDGFISAVIMSYKGGKPIVKVYDVEGTYNIQAIYNQAIDEGADFIVGPLKKDSVLNISKAINNESKKVVPTLALNYLPEYETPPRLMFQFGLLPENEAEEAAELAVYDGYSKALVLVPDSDWGTRLSAAFSNKLIDLGGETVAETFFDPKSSDYSDAIKNLLNIDDSIRRNQQLQNTIHNQVHFEPRRRQDIDFIFIAGSPTQARLIRPQFDFHRASQIKMYTVSSAYTGTPNPDKDMDMNGVSFVDMPWLLSEANSPLREEFDDSWSSMMKKYHRFYALGIDSFNVISELFKLGANPELSFNGHTGKIYITDGKLLRKLDAADFYRGIPQIRPDIPRVSFQQESYNEPNNENGIYIENSYSKKNNSEETYQQ